jgi:hypothetical protein
MPFRRFRYSGSCLVFASLCLIASAQSDEWLRRSVVELDSPAEVPGAILAPGRYVFQLMDVDDHRKLMQILDYGQTRVIATFAAVPDHRLRPEFGESIVFFELLNNAKPPVIRTWYWDTDMDGYHPQELNGYEFVYPSARAIELAKTIDDYVMASDTFGGVIRAIMHQGISVPIVDAMSTDTLARVRAAM